MFGSDKKYAHSMSYCVVLLHLPPPTLNDIVKSLTAEARLRIPFMNWIMHLEICSAIQ